MKRVDIFSKKYYTDWHDVDEDLTAIAIYGGTYDRGNTVGIMNRNLYDSSTNIFNSVASRKK